MQVSKNRQESIARAEMIYTQIQLVFYMSVTAFVSIGHRLNKNDLLFADIIDWCIIAVWAYFAYQAYSKALAARSRWRELTE